MMHPRSRRIPRYALLCALVVASWVPHAQAQFAGEIPNVPAEFIQRFRQVDGELLRLCVYDDGVGGALDRRVAEAIGEMLLVEVRIVSMFSPIQVVGIEFVPISEDELFIYLNNDCDGVMGMVLAGDVYPEWLTFTRPYVTSGFVAVTIDAGLGRLADLPPGERIGATMLSEADLQLISFNNALASERRWRRIPYNFATVLVERVLDGSVAAALVWEPSLRWMAINQVHPVGDLRLISTAPLTIPRRQVGIVLRSNETALRYALDQAIEALAQAGLLQQLYHELDYPGQVPGR
jgi:polar amino acid transport system substrate-binding protein